ncbi:hypothetical protein [Candidatus Poriferisocius sp.]|uniref:hypothetical protein n=1 Tax=Candidatus Poriferisocius sp. TaxID=3101276 RepID=UPI003B01780C
MLALIPSWLAIGLLVVLAVGGLAAVAGLLFASFAMFSKADGIPRAVARGERQGDRWAVTVLVSGALAALVCACVAPVGIWVAARTAVWDKSVLGQAQARSGHWEQRVEPASDWAGQPA